MRERFNLLKNIPNILKLSSSDIQEYGINNGPRKIFVVLEMIKNRINHFTKDSVYQLISNTKERDLIQIVNYPDYPLYVSYNQPTKSLLINLAPFGVDDIYPNNPDPRNIYACIVYGISFYSLISEKSNIKTQSSPAIVDFMVSLFIKLFGKEFGLLGGYSLEIPKLKFIISMYVLRSFFDVSGSQLLRHAASLSAYNYSSIEDKLGAYDFTNIEDFIRALSDLGVMPGLNRYGFTAKFLKSLTIQFLPALEDLPRFVSILTTSDISGSNLVPTFVRKYNYESYLRILEISKLIFKKKPKIR